MNLSTEAWLHAGRKPTVVAAAAVRLAIEARGELGMPPVEFARRVECSDFTLRKRLNELKASSCAHMHAHSHTDTYPQPYGYNIYLLNTYHIG